jgi:3D (Asp-Asp-Asp) domain-containing protein
LTIRSAGIGPPSGGPDRPRTEEGANNVSFLTQRARYWLAATAAAAAGAAAVALGPLDAASAAGPSASAAAAALPSCPFWDAGVTPPPRSVTPWTPPLQTAAPVDFSGRPAAPALSGTLSGGQVTITISQVPNAVAYKVWRDGVDIGYVSYWGQTTPLTVTDTAPCQNAYYDVVAMYDTSGSDASMGQLSQPYWLGADGTIAPGPGDVPVGTTVSMMVTSYNDVGQTASGYNAQLGGCATDPRVIPWGTYFTVPGYGTCLAIDIGTWIQNDTVDVWLPGNQANGWGVQDRTITVIANPFGGPGPSTGPSASASASASPSASPSTGPSTSPSASASASPSPSSGGSCWPAWNPNTSYVPGDKVSYQGVNYTATYYSTGAVPGAPTSWDVWSSNGAC